MKTRFLFVFARPPHASLHVREMLDMTLTAAAFDQAVSVLLIDDGVYSLKSGQDSRQLDCKDVIPVFESLAWYEVEHIYVEAESLQERSLSPAELCQAVHLLSRSEIGKIMSRQNVIVNV
ncbi:MAG: sulfurtransferase complex subunit TusC [Methylococcales bacterium]